jgi:hypothetical protein
MSYNKLREVAGAEFKCCKELMISELHCKLRVMTLQAKSLIVSDECN